ncbi:MAG: lytic murein transglycosylase B [Betaproteobacteria bacterium HGW-Betaproteobacteria-11]|nr:MAG: lytic murein transglycosylase B [Betaproteobacteria bacterium HGW-Betaproteobacteria-11]
MRKLLFLLLLTCSPLHAGNYAAREDVRAFIDDMKTRHGFSDKGLTSLFRRTHPIAAVLKAIRPPVDPGIRSWQKYRSRFVEPRRIAAGHRFMQQHAADLAAAEAQFGVPAEIITSIIGIETIYGQHMGDFNTFAALATLAFDYPPRAELFRRELEELLLLAREEQTDPLSYTGSYAGALGLAQFMPSSLRRYAIDFDHDGQIDLEDSPSDAIGSVARFLAEHGWRTGEPVSVTVNASGDGVQAQLDAGIEPRLTADEMRQLAVRLDPPSGPGITAAPAAGEGTKFPAACRSMLADGNPALPGQPAALIDLVTPAAATEYRLGYRNFWVITRYNRSSFYAAAVTDLAMELCRLQ